MALSQKVLARELNNLQKNLDFYQTQVAEGKDVEFNKEQVKYYRDEVTRIRTAWLNSTEDNGDDDAPAAASPAVAPPPPPPVAAKPQAKAASVPPPPPPSPNTDIM